MADISTHRKNIEGQVAHDDAVGGNPVLTGLEARTTLPTAVGDGDAARALADDLGRAIAYPIVPRDLIVHNRIALTTTTETTLIAAGGAGVFRDVIQIVVHNSSSSVVAIDFRDATGGTIRHTAVAAADGGGAVIPFKIPLTQAVANNNWTAQLGTAVSTVYITAIAAEQN